MEIVPDAVFEARVSPPAVNLSVSGQSRANAVPQIVIGVLPAELTGKFRTLGPWTDEAHLTAEHVPELRQFVEAVTPQIMSDPRTPRISWNGPDSPEIAFGIGVHCAELDDRKTPPVESDASLAIQDGPTVRHLDSNCNQKEQRRQHEQSRDRDSDIGGAFDKSACAGDRFMRTEAPRLLSPI